MVNCLESYYISEGLFTTEDNLDSKREIKLIVLKVTLEKKYCSFTNWWR